MLYAETVSGNILPIGGGGIFFLAEEPFAVFRPGNPPAGFYPLSG
jgi:hypothetical protein